MVTISTRQFGLVHGLVGLSQQLIRILITGIRFIKSNANTCGNLKGDTADADRLIGRIQ